jgi:hypothetical protein
MPKLMVSAEDSYAEEFEAETLTGAIGELLAVYDEVQPETCDYDLADLLMALAKLATKADDNDKAIHRDSIGFDEIKLAWGFDTWEAAAEAMDIEAQS